MGLTEFSDVYYWPVYDASTHRQAHLNGQRLPTAKELRGAQAWRPAADCHRRALLRWLFLDKRTLPLHIQHRDRAPEAPPPAARVKLPLTRARDASGTPVRLAGTPTGVRRGRSVCAGPPLLWLTAVAAHSTGGRRRSPLAPRHPSVSDCWCRTPTPPQMRCPLVATHHGRWRRLALLMTLACCPAVGAISSQPFRCAWGAAGALCVMPARAWAGAGAWAPCRLRAAGRVATVPTTPEASSSWPPCFVQAGGPPQQRRVPRYRAHRSALVRRRPRGGGRPQNVQMAARWGLAVRGDRRLLS